MDDALKERLQKIRLRKLNCERQIHLLMQKLAGSHRNRLMAKELEKLQKLLAELEEQEKRLLDEKKEATLTGGWKDADFESEDSGSR
ncbi:MAG: BREX-1 system adenine-specific DNA-methyltransferase PglX [Armatimonadetes bacterium]|nr:BREX-1 system adenine-specific DNA-methyltransferase PglX [Armatimonadota bacterium]